MKFFDVTLGNTETRLFYTENNFGEYNDIALNLKQWVSLDSNRFAYIKFGNKLIDTIRWGKDTGKLVVLHFNDVEEVAKNIREKKRNGK